MAEKESIVAGQSAPVTPTKAEVEERLRKGPVRSMGGMVANSVFMDPNFQATMNWWMIRTHISWGISLAIFFTAILQLMSFIQVTFGVTNLETGLVLLPIGGGYLLYQSKKFKKPQLPPIPAMANSPD